MTSRSRHGQMIILCARRQTVLRKNMNDIAQSGGQCCAKMRKGKRTEKNALRHVPFPARTQTVERKPPDDGTTMEI